MKQSQHTLLAYRPSDRARLRRGSFDYQAKYLGLARSQWRTMACINRQHGTSRLAEVLDIGGAPMGN